MKITAIVVSAFLLISYALQTSANTWDEPWHEEVVEKATSFGLYHIESVDGETAKVSLVKHLEGMETPSELTISGYSNLRIRSSSSNEWNLRIQPDMDYYLFLSGSESDRWQLPTPTSGYAMVRPAGDVAATYRISMHKTQIPADYYELTQVCIYMTLHGRQCDNKEIEFFINEVTSYPVAELGPDATPEVTEIFFLQHVALETATLAGFTILNTNLERFLASDYFHVQFSALRYLAASDDDKRYARIADFVCDASNNALSRKLGVLLLELGDARSEADKLEQCIKIEPEDDSLLVDIMDPRISTYFPSELKSGVDALLAKWKSRSPQ